MADKCDGCIFAFGQLDEELSLHFEVCTRESDFIEAVNARNDKEECPWHITYKKIIELQDNGVL